jgi:predicted nuclease with TOPRIM domain
MNTCQQKQTDLLSFTSKLTDKNTNLQSDNSALEEKLNVALKQLENVTSQLNQSNQSVDGELKRLNLRLEEEIRKSSQLFEKLTQKSKQAEELSVRLADEQNENATLKKKHAANIKDLTRQLQTLEKKNSSQHMTPIVGQSTSTTGCSSSANSTSSFYRLPSNSEFSISGGIDVASRIRSGSRTNSISSLNDRDDISMNSDNSTTRQQNHSTNSELLVNENAVYSQTSTSTKHSNNHGLSSTEVICGNEEVYVVDIEKQKIIEKIVKLQKTLAKRNEKIDFLQDHVNQLTADLKRKTK